MGFLSTCYRFFRHEGEASSVQIGPCVRTVKDLHWRVPGKSLIKVIQINTDLGACLRGKRFPMGGASAGFTPHRLQRFFTPDIGRGVLRMPFNTHHCSLVMSPQCSQSNTDRAVAFDGMNRWLGNDDAHPPAVAGAFQQSIFRFDSHSCSRILARSAVALSELITRGLTPSDRCGQSRVQRLRLALLAAHNLEHAFTGWPQRKAPPFFVDRRCGRIALHRQTLIAAQQP